MVSEISTPEYKEYRAEYVIPGDKGKYNIVHKRIVAEDIKSAEGIARYFENKMGGSLSITERRQLQRQSANVSKRMPRISKCVPRLK